MPILQRATSKIIQYFLLTANLAYCKIIPMKLKAYRKKTGKKQSEAAKELGISVKYYGRIENDYPAGRKLSNRIEVWSGGEVKAVEVLYP